ncbi:hypothetical protein H2200_002976 [Cladophialophora chaetospira]|uniref:Uncharacterized protein n=1 Tax=Cladophialophora chaetospira TaxID=386627 RepID=A0AA38XGH3_9EURO|nr:hypothetical protein H2200_002976 [Cladophialophora chaetospira]
MRPKSTPEPALLSAIPRVVVEDTVRYWNQQALDLNPFHGLKTLELRNIIIWCKYHDEAYLQSTEGDDCMLQLALFNLNRIHPDLKRICAASDRSFEILLWCQYVVSSSTHETIHAVIDVDKQVVLRKFKGPANRDRNAWAGFY